MEEFDGLFQKYGSVSFGNQEEPTQAEEPAPLFERYSLLDKPQEAQEGPAVSSFTQDRELPEQNVEPSTNPMFMAPESQLDPTELPEDTLGRIADFGGWMGSWTGIPKAFALTNRATAFLQEKASSLMGYEPSIQEGFQKTKEYWDQKVKDYSIEGFDQNIIDNPWVAANPFFWTYHVGQMLPAAAGGPAGGAVGAATGAAFMSIPEATLTYDEVLKETGGDKTAATGAAMTNFAVNSVLESLGLNSIIKPVGRIGSRLFKGFVAEGGTEFTQSLSNDIQKDFWEGASKGLSAPEIVESIVPKLKGYFKNAAGAGIVGGVIGGGISGITGSTVEAEQLLADQGIINQDDVGVPPVVRETINGILSNPAYAPVTETTQETSQQAVTQAQDTLAQMEIPGITQEVVSEVDQAGTQPVVQPTEEQGIQQPTEVTEGVPTPSETGVQPEAQTVTQEPPGILPDGTISGPLELESKTQAPIVEEKRSWMLGDPREPNVLTPEQVQGIQQETTQQAPTTKVEYGQADQELTPAQLEHVRQIEPETYGVLEEQLFGKQGFIPGSYTGETLKQAKATMSEKAAPLAAIVRGIQKAGIEEEVKSRVEAIAGPVKSLVSGATKVGDTTFRNIVKDTIEGKRRELLGLTEATDNLYQTPGTSILSTQTPINLDNQPESLDIKDNSAELQQEIQRLSETVSESNKEILNTLESIPGPSLASAAINLGIAKEVKAYIEKDLDATYESLSTLSMVVGQPKMVEAIRAVWDAKLREQAEVNLRSSIEPSTALKDMEASITTPSQIEPSRPRRTSEEDIEAKRAENEAVTRAKAEAEGEVNQAMAEAKDLVGKKKDLKKWAERNLMNGIELLGKIHPALKGIMKRFEARVMDTIVLRQKEIEPFKQIYKSMDKADRRILSKALYNQMNVEERAALDKMLNEKEGLREAYDKTKAVLDQIQNDFIATGLLSRNKVQKYYFPRKVKDLDGLMAYLNDYYKEPGAVIKELKKLTGQDKITDAEARTLVQRLLERGGVPGMLLNPQSVKGRTIWTVEDDMMKFYMNPIESLDAHIREATEAIEQRRIIGSTKYESNLKKLEELKKKLIKTDNDIKELNTLETAMNETTIGGSEQTEGILTDFISETLLANGAERVPYDQQRMAMEVFRARFNQKAMTRGFAALKDLGVASALGQVTSTITQLGDIMPLIRNYGIKGTMEAISQEKQLKRSDADLHAFTKDVGETNLMSSALDKILKWTGFQAVDGFFAATNMQAALNRAKRLSLEQLKQDYGHIFNDQELQQIKDDAQAGTLSDLSRQYAFIELSETRPLFPTDMPIGYMQGGNMRVLYALKSWNLKMLNNIARDTRMAYKKEGKVAAAKTMLSYVVLLAAAGAGTDILKDLLMGRVVDVPETVGDNLLKLVFSSRYMFDKATKEKNLGRTIAGFFAPPTKWIDNSAEDIYEAFKEDGDVPWKSINTIPVFGGVLYNWTTDAAAKRRHDDVRKRAFDYLKDATVDRDKGAMEEFRRLRAEYNKLVKGTESKPITYESVSRAQERYRKEARGKKMSNVRQK